MALLRDVLDRVLFPNRELHTIPVLDGAFSPNSRLDASRTLGAPIERPDDFAAGPDGALYVSSGNRIVRCTGADFEQRTGFATLPGPAGPLAWTPAGRLLVGVSGHGVVALSAAGAVTATLAEAGGVALRCPTALLADDDGTVFICDGSRANQAEDWLVDLMQSRAASGRLVACSAALTDARVLADALAWPAGLAAAPAAGEVLVAEAWTHRLSAFARNGGARRVIVKNFAGYPARLAADEAGGYWMAFFGMRTQLIEFVLRERAFCDAMMATVPRDLWIGPSLEGHFDYREPTQIGRIKKLGIQKPWAPPRSYGLVARLDAHGEPVESLHSRVEGRVHGVTAVRRVGDRVLAVAKGRDLLVELPAGGASK
jgi:Strictosidine synthase/Strictosidine synthase-like, N-terminal